MSMYSMRLSFLKKQFPQDKEAINRLTHLFSETERPAEFDIDRLCDVTHSRSRERLVLILGWFVAHKKAILKYRVISPKWGTAIKEFDRLEDIPDTIHDWRQDSDITVTSNELSIVYKLPEKRGIFK